MYFWVYMHEFQVYLNVWHWNLNVFQLLQASALKKKTQMI